MEVESHVLHWTSFFNSCLQRPARCQDHTSKGTGESVFPGSSTDVLYFLCCFMCCLLGACQTEKGSKEECSAHSPSGRCLDPGAKPVEAWATSDRPASCPAGPEGWVWHTYLMFRRVRRHHCFPPDGKPRFNGIMFKASRILICVLLGFLSEEKPAILSLLNMATVSSLLYCVKDRGRGGYLNKTLRSLLPEQILHAGKKKKRERFQMRNKNLF